MVRNEDIGDGRIISGMGGGGGMPHPVPLGYHVFTYTHLYSATNQHHTSNIFKRSKALEQIVFDKLSL